MKLPILTRGECREWLRPCVLSKCPYHLSSIAKRPLAEIGESCVLDIAEDGMHTAEELSALLGIPTSTIESLEASGRKKLREQAHTLGMTSAEQPARSIHDRVLTQLRRTGPARAHDVARALGASRHTVTHALIDLRKRGIANMRSPYLWYLNDEGVAA